MLRVFRFVAAVAVLALAACEVETETTLSDPAADQRDDRLLGEWYRSGEKEFGVLSIRPDPRRPGVMNIVYLDFGTGHARVATFRAWPTRIGNHDFLNLEKLHGLGEWTDRTFVHYAVAADGKLRFRWLRDQTIADAIRAGELGGRPKEAAASGASTPTTITAPRAALVAFIAARGPGLFTEGAESGSHWVRLPSQSADRLEKMKDEPKTTALVTENLLSDADAAGYDARLVGDRVLSIGPYVGIVSVRPERAEQPGPMRVTIAYVLHVPGNKWPLEPVDVLTFRAWRTVVDGRDFLNVEGVYAAKMLFRTKVILGYEIGADGAFRLRLAEADAIDAAKKSGELATTDGGSTISATREALRAFIAARGPSLWHERYTELGPYSALPPTVPKQ